MRDAREETVLFDPNIVFPGGRTAVEIVSISDCGSRVAFGIREGGDDELEIHFIDVEAKHILSDYLPKGIRVFSAPADLSAYYYGVATPDGFSVRFHLIGSAIETDKEIFTIQGNHEASISVVCAPNNSFVFLIVWRSRDCSAAESYIFWPAIASLQVLQGLSDPTPTVRCAENTVYVLTNQNSPNKKIVAYRIHEGCIEGPRDIVQEQSNVIKTFTIVDQTLMVIYYCGALTELRAINVENNEDVCIVPVQRGTIALPLAIQHDHEIFYSVSTFSSPVVIWKYKCNQQGTQVWHQQEVVDDDRIVQVDEVSYPSKDGTLIHMFLAYRKDLVPHGNAGALLTAYGGFGLSQTPRFTTRAAIWMDLGGVVAWANIRGGTEGGAHWHTAAIGKHRQVAFDDFISAAEWLIREGYAKPERLAIAGGSNAGLLVGAAITQRPELFRVAICSMPLLDMLRYHLDPSAWSYVGELGTAQRREDFDYLRQYSPYHRVVPGTPYPAVMFISGDMDSRCDPMHARKMTAKLQAASSSKLPIILNYNRDRGHAGFLPQRARVEALTDQICFILSNFKPAG
jgi:prolyl oligopeptidase